MSTVTTDIVGKSAQQKSMQQPEKVTSLTKALHAFYPLTLLLSQVSFTHILIPTDSQQEAYTKVVWAGPFGYNTKDEGCQVSRPHYISEILPAWQ